MQVQVYYQKRRLCVCVCVCVCVCGGGGGGVGVNKHARYFFVRKLNTVFEWEGNCKTVVLH